MTDQTASASEGQQSGAEDADAVEGILSDGAHSLIIARFKTMDEAVAARETLAGLSARPASRSTA